MTRVSCAAIVMSMIVTLASCGGRESADETKASDATPQRLRADGSIQLTDQDRTALGLVVSTAAEADLPQSSLRFGRVLSPPMSEGQVVAPVTGRIMHPPHVQLGAAVRAGATVLDLAPTLDTPDRIAVGTQSAERAGQIEVAERELAKADADAARARALSPQVVSAAKLQEAETAVATARAHLDGLRNARAAADQARMQAVSVTTPIAGVVSALNVEVGALVNKGDVLARVLSSGPVWVDVSVPPDDPQGDHYLIETPSGSIPARLLARGHLTDADGTRHDRLVVEPPASSTLSPGSSVPVHVARGAARGVIVPASALVPGVDGDTIFVEVTPNVFAARPVQIAARFGDRLRVSSGVKAGERVVTQGVMGLQGERLRSQLRNVEQ
jgi:cobalt-zinc-cadmium efflux system membrane fusion protein